MTTIDAERLTCGLGFALYSAQSLAYNVGTYVLHKPDMTMFLLLERPMVGRMGLCRKLPKTGKLRITSH